MTYRVLLARAISHGDSAWTNSDLSIPKAAKPKYGSAESLTEAQRRDQTALLSVPLRLCDTLLLYL
jgi:hypothetical protein